MRPKFRYVYNREVKDWLHVITREATMHNFKPAAIIAPNRGGLALGVMLSHYYDAPLFPIQLSHRDADIVDVMDIAEGLKDGWRKGPIMVIDDINDTGKTLESIKRVAAETPLAGEIKYAVLLEKQSSKESADFVGTYIDEEQDEQWVVFPWEDWWVRA